MALTTAQKIQLLRSTEHAWNLASINAAVSSVGDSDLIAVGTPEFAASAAVSPPSVASGTVAVLGDGDELQVSDDVRDTEAVRLNLRAFSFWFRFRQAPNASTDLLEVRDSGAFEFKLSYSTLSNRLFLFHYINEGRFGPANNSLLPADTTTWQHVVVTFEPGGNADQTPGHTRMFINGTFAAEITGVGGNPYPLSAAVLDSPKLLGSSDVIEYAAFQLVTGDASGDDVDASLYSGADYASWLYNSGQGRTYGELGDDIKAQATPGELAAASATDSGQQTTGAGVLITGTQSPISDVIAPPPTVTDYFNVTNGTYFQMASVGQRTAFTSAGQSGLVMSITDATGQNRTFFDASLFTLTAESSFSKPPDGRDMLAGTAQELEDELYFPFSAKVLPGPTEEDPSLFVYFASRRIYDNDLGDGDRENPDNYTHDRLGVLSASVDELPGNSRPTFVIQSSPADHEQPRSGENNWWNNIGQVWAANASYDAANDLWLLTVCNYLGFGETGLDTVHVAYAKFENDAWTLSDFAEVIRGGQSRHTHAADARILPSGQLEVTWSQGDNLGPDDVNGDPSVEQFVLMRRTNGNWQNLFDAANPLRDETDASGFFRTSTAVWDQEVLPASEGTTGWGAVQLVHGSPINADRLRGIQPVGMAYHKTGSQWGFYTGADERGGPLVSEHDPDAIPVEVRAAAGSPDSWKICFQLDESNDRMLYASGRPDDGEVPAESLFVYDDDSREFVHYYDVPGRAQNFQASPLGVPFATDGVVKVIAPPASFRRSRPFIAEQSRQNVLENITANLRSAAVSAGATLTEMSDADLAALGLPRPPQLPADIPIWRVQWPQNAPQNIAEFVADSVTLSGNCSVTAAFAQVPGNARPEFNLRGYIDDGNQGGFALWLDLSGAGTPVKGWKVRSFVGDGSTSGQFGGTGEPTFLLRSNSEGSDYAGDVLVAFAVQPTASSGALRIAAPGQTEATLSATASIPVVTDGPSVVYAVASAGGRIASGDTLDVVTFDADGTYITVKATRTSFIIENSGADVATVTSLDGASIDIWDGVPIRAALHYNGLGTEVWLSHGGRAFELVYTTGVASEPEIERVRAGGPASRSATQSPANLYAVASQAGVYLLDGEDVREWAQHVEKQVAAIVPGFSGSPFLSLFGMM